MKEKKLNRLFFKEKIHLFFCKNNEDELLISLEKCFSAFESVVDGVCKDFVEEYKASFDKINKIDVQKASETSFNLSLADGDNCSILAAKRKRKEREDKVRSEQNKKDIKETALAEIKTSIQILDLAINELYKQSLSKSYKLISVSKSNCDNPFEKYNINLIEKLGLEGRIQ